MTEYQLPKDKVIYNYRYFLPYAPEWGSEELCNQRLDELVEYCKAAKLDAVQFFVNTLPATCYMPAHNAAEQAHRAKWMREVVAPTLRGIGVSYQLNLQMLMGATTCGLDMRDEYEWEYLVSEYGDQNLGCACPIGPKFRKIMGEMLRLWAWTDPDVIWVDDDFRMHNHGSMLGSPDYYCYCDLHLDAFAQRAGKRYSREELLAETLKIGEPTQLRLQWLDFLGDSMIECADWIKREVQGENPRTRLALMTSCPEVHAAEGRKWKEFLTALCEPYAPMTRPMGGIYTANNAPVKALACTYDYMHQSLEVLENTIGKGITDNGIEIENTRFTTWSKSVSCTQFQMTVSQLCGCTQATLSLNDLEGSPIMEEPTCVSMLTDIRPRLQSLVDLNLNDWKALGVSLLLDQNAARKVQIDEPEGYGALASGRTWPQILLEMGIPCKYVTPSQAAGSADVIALDRYSAWLPSDSELEKMLSGNVFLDGAAADVVSRRGFKHLLGVEVGELHKTGEIAEKFMSDILPGVYEVRVPHRGFLWREMVSTGAVVASEFIDPKDHRVPGSTYFENSAGGRIAVYAAIGDFSWGTFGSHARSRWLRGVLRKLSQDTFPALPIVPHHSLTITRSQEETLLIALANLGTDTIQDINFITGTAQYKNLEILTKDGKWIPQGVDTSKIDGAWSLNTKSTLNVYDFLILKVS